MSIIIIGIGTASFDSMRALDGDGGRLSQDSQVAMRDIVQFVEFDKHASNGVRLAEELLAELPGQFLQYMR